jgi:dihydrofolate synthase/folylpolyglutamate synthase
MAPSSRAILASPASPVPSPDRSAALLDRLQRLHPKVIDLSLERLRRLLTALGEPQRRLPPVVHVAGTNGKGSTLAFLRAMLEAAGHSVHVYTSPHLVDFHERIRLAATAGGGRLIEDDHLAALLEECEAANAGLPITFFEITTAAALLAFARVPAAAVLLETGLGGRLDATNVVERPAVTAITRISYDHMAFLGSTLTEIAGEKAGILRPGVPLVLAPQPAAEAAVALGRAAAAIGAPILDWRVEPLAEGGFLFASPGRRLVLPAPGLAGAHQIVNAGTAIACLAPLAARLPVDDNAVARGLNGVAWPARLQRLVRGPLAARLPPGWQVWLDGGHNDSAGEVLAVQAAAWARETPPLPLILVFGMLGTKQPVDFLAPLAGAAVRLYGVPIPGEHGALSAEAAADAARAAGLAQAQASADVAGALDTAVAAVSGPCRVLICGSLYLAGAVLRENG